MRTVPDIVTVHQALVTGHVIDVATGAAPRTDFAVRTDRPALATRAVPPGRYCLSGHEADLAPLLTVNVAISAHGYRDGTLRVDVPAQPAYPLEGKDVQVVPVPVTIQGRVTTPTHAAVKDARVDLLVTGADVLAVRRPVAHDHPKGAELRTVTVPPGAHATTLRAAASPGALTLALQARGPLAAGAQLSLGWPDPIEAVSVQAPGPGPEDVTLTAPLARAHAAGAPVQAVAVRPVVTTLERACTAGDGVLVLAGPFVGETLELRDPAGRREHRFAGALSNDAGYFFLGGVTGVSAVGLTATPPGAAAGPVVRVTVDYDLSTNVVNLPAS
jgi:hypothetical protein